jgi:hypothetical protein
MTSRRAHGQSLAYAARAAGIPAVIAVPEGNNAEKNDAMEALGAELIVAGADFDEAPVHAAWIAAARPDLDTVYVRSAWAGRSPSRPGTSSRPSGSTPSSTASPTASPTPTPSR